MTNGEEDRHPIKSAPLPSSPAAAAPLEGVDRSPAGLRIRLGDLSWIRVAEGGAGSTTVARALELGRGAASLFIADSGTAALITDPSWDTVGSPAGAAQGVLLQRSAEPTTQQLGRRCGPVRSRWIADRCVSAADGGTRLLPYSSSSAPSRASTLTRWPPARCRSWSPRSKELASEELPRIVDAYAFDAIRTLGDAWFLDEDRAWVLKHAARATRPSTAPRDPAILDT